MRELSLFTGAGGGVLGSKLLGWNTIGYVEWDTYCQKVIAARIADGHLPAAPIFGDVREFVLSGAAAEYRGIADVVSGGFPCQPFSVAGKRAGADDNRNMWPATIATIRAVEPRYAFLENVPGLVSSGYFGTILGDLAESGYDVRWRILSAAELGAPHKRDRLWIVANTNSKRSDEQRIADAGNGGAFRASREREPIGDSSPSDVPDADSAERRGNGAQRQAHQRDTQPARDGEPGHVAHSHSGRCKQRNAHNGAIPVAYQNGADVPHANGAGRGEQWRAVPGGEFLAASQLNRWWEVEPNVGRVVNGIPFRMDRIKALGNGVVPQQAKKAFMNLMGLKENYDEVKDETKKEEA
jgi:DNA (cytosine-5)-methyltransferase 1